MLALLMLCPSTRCRLQPIFPVDSTCHIRFLPPVSSHPLDGRRTDGAFPDAPESEFAGEVAERLKAAVC